MLNSVYTRIGIGRANYNGKWYWVTDFANGTAGAMTSQCGQAVTQPPPPPVVSVKPPPPPVTKITEPAPAVEIPIATTTATISAEIATKSATKSPKIIKIGDESKKEGQTLVQGVAATTIVLGNMAIFGFIVLRLYRKHKFFE